MLKRPNENEFPAYYVPYVKAVPEGELLNVLQENYQRVVDLFSGISEAEGLYRYAEGKWSIKEVLSHVTDTERIMSYRLLRIGRGDQTELAGFEENLYVSNSKANELPIKKILADFIAVRTATITLIENMPESAWENVGNANHSAITTRAIAYILAGHEIHHRNIINEKYLAKLR